MFDIAEDLIILGMVADNAEQVIRELGACLLKKGYVSTDYTDSVLDREQVYPTGLASEIPVAIPHTDPIHCYTSAIAIGILVSPVRFGAAGDVGNFIHTRIVFLLSIVDQVIEAPLVILLSDMIRQPQALRKILESKTATDVVKTMKEYLELP